PPETKPSDLLILLRLVGRYWRKGRVARRFFWGTIWEAVRRSPRSLAQVITYLGMYEHFCKVHAGALAWDPWAEAERPPTRGHAPSAAPTEEGALPVCHA